MTSVIGNVIFSLTYYITNLVLVNNFNTIYGGFGNNSDVFPNSFF